MKLSTASTLLLAVCAVAATPGRSGDVSRDALSAEQIRAALSRRQIERDPSLLEQQRIELTRLIDKQLAFEDERDQRLAKLERDLDLEPAQGPQLRGAYDDLAEQRRRRQIVFTSADWKLLTATRAPIGWTNLDFDAAAWSAAVDQGALGTAPWLAVQLQQFKSPARWIWSHRSNGGNDSTTVYFRHLFVPQRALSQLLITADNEFWVYIDGREVGHGNDWQREWTFAVALAPGRQHLIAVKVSNWGGPGGLLAELR